MNFVKIALATVAVFVSSFVIQGLLAFAFASDYFMSIPIMRQSPLVYLSVPATIFAGIALGVLYPLTNLQGTTLLRGLKFGLIVGVATVPFVALDIPGRFAIPSVEKWIFVQGTLGMIHSAIAGVLIAMVYGKGKASA